MHVPDQAGFRGALDRLPALVMLFDAERRIVYANDALATAVGCAVRALMGLDCSRLWHPDDQPAFEALLAAPLVNSHGPRRLRLAASTGATVEVEVSLMVGLRLAGRPVRGVFATDLTHQRATEASRVRGEEAQRAGVTERHEQERQLAISERMASLGTFAAGIAHEINNPLTFLIANTELVAEKLAAFKRGEQLDVTELLQLIAESRDGVQRVQKLVASLRVFAHSDKGSITSVGVEQVVEQALKLADGQLAGRARLVRDFGHPPPARANADQLSQAIVNLLVNAAQAIPAGAKDTNEIRVTTRTDAGNVVIEVADSGVGIPADALPRVFDPFFTTRGVGEGTGMGLTMSHRIIKEFDGELSVASEPGRGATFRIELKPGSTQPFASSASPAPTSAQPLVLIIDDEPLVARAIARGLRGYVVEALNDGEAALSRLGRAPRPDVILCDLMLPGLTGMDIFERACATDPALGPRFLFMSGGAFTPRTREFQEAHDQAFVEKPVLPAALRERVKQVLKATAAPPPHGKR